MNRPFRAIDRRAARRRFERAAESYAQASKLEAEIAARMLERLDYVKLEPRRILDAGSGPPRPALAARYPRASTIALDFALPMLPKPRAWSRLVRARVLALCADLERLPLADGSIDLVWSNMALHWLGDPLGSLKEFARVLSADGLLMFSTLGPDSLKELRAVAGAGRVHDFIDMHDLGDMLLAIGFSAPVMDMELVTFAYRDAESLLRDLRASGQTSALADRPRGLSGRQFGARLRGGLAEAPRVTFEVVYGHAWRARKQERDARDEVKTVRVFKNIS